MTLHIEPRLVERTDNHPNKEFENGIADYITIHETANPDAGASAHSSWMYREAGAPHSWHATIDDSVTAEGEPMVYQSFPWSSQCWHAGDGAAGEGNTKSIGLELCVNNDMDVFSTRVLDTAAELVAYLRSLGHGGQGIVMHKHWSGKHCPTRIIENNLWDTLLKKVAQFEKAKETVYVPTTPVLEAAPPITRPIPTSPPPAPPPVPNLFPTKAPTKNNQPQQISLIQSNRTLKKAAPEVAATGSTGGLLALLNSVGIDVEMEVVIAVMVAVPPLLFAARRLLRDAIKTIKELKQLAE